MKVWRAAVFKNAEGHFHARERRAQLMRDVAQKPFLTVHKAIESTRHDVDGCAQLADFIVAALVHPDGKITAGHPPGDLPHLRQ